MLVGGIQARVGKKVEDTGLSGTVEVNAPVDASQPPHVLILQVGAITVFVYLASQEILPPAHIGGDIKLGRAFGVLRVPHLLTVNPDIHRSCAPFKMEEHTAAIPVGRQFKGVTIRSNRRIIPFNARRRGPEAKTGAHIHRQPEPVELPVARHRYFRPGRNIVRFLVKTNRHFGHFRHPVKFPQPV